MGFLIYFPSNPPSPPSASAGQGREQADVTSISSILADIYRLCTTSAPFVLLLCFYSIVIGLGSDASSLLTANIARLGGDQLQASRMGMISSSLGLVAGLYFAFLFFYFFFFFFLFSFFFFLFSFFFFLFSFFFFLFSFSFFVALVHRFLCPCPNWHFLQGWLLRA